MPDKLDEIARLKARLKKAEAVCEAAQLVVKDCGIEPFDDEGVKLKKELHQSLSNWLTTWQEARG